MDLMQVYIDGDDNLYDVETLWKIAPSRTRIRTSTLLNGLDEKVWGLEKPTPRQVLELKEGEIWGDVLSSSLRYALIVAPDLSIADGHHRILKALYLGKTHVWARIFAKKSDMSKALMGKATELFY